MTEKTYDRLKPFYERKVGYWMLALFVIGMFVLFASKGFLGTICGIVAFLSYVIYFGIEIEFRIKKSEMAVDRRVNHWKKAFKAGVAVPYPF